MFRFRAKNDVIDFGSVAVFLVTVMLARINSIFLQNNCNCNLIEKKIKNLLTITEAETEKSQLK